MNVESAVYMWLEHSGCINDRGFLSWTVRKKNISEPIACMYPKAMSWEQVASQKVVFCGVVHNNLTSSLSATWATVFAKTRIVVCASNINIDHEMTNRAILIPLKQCLKHIIDVRDWRWLKARKIRWFCSHTYTHTYIHIYIYILHTRRFPMKLRADGQYRMNGSDPPGTISETVSFVKNQDEDSSVPETGSLWIWPGIYIHLSTVLYCTVHAHSRSSLQLYVYDRNQPAGVDEFLSMKLLISWLTDYHKGWRWLGGIWANERPRWTLSFSLTRREDHTHLLQPHVFLAMWRNALQIPQETNKWSQ